MFFKSGLVTWMPSNSSGSRHSASLLLAGSKWVAQSLELDAATERLLLRDPSRGERSLQVSQLQHWTLGQECGMKGIHLRITGEEQPWFAPFYAADGKASYMEITRLDHCMVMLHKLSITASAVTKPEA